MLPVVIPLRLFLGQFFCICMGLAIESFVISRRAELPRQVAFHYSLVSNIVAVFSGWLAIFAVWDFLMQGVREQQILSYLFAGEFVSELPIVSTQTALTLLAAVLFVGGFLLKPYSISMLERFDLVPPMPEVNVGDEDPRLVALVQLRVRQRIDGSMRLGHILSTIATLLFFALLEASLWA